MNYNDPSMWQGAFPIQQQPVQQFMPYQQPQQPVQQFMPYQQPQQLVQQLMPYQQPQQQFVQQPMPYQQLQQQKTQQLNNIQTLNDDDESNIFDMIVEAEQQTTSKKLIENIVGLISEIEKRAEIRGAIDALCQLNYNEEAIQTAIMTRYNLSKEQVASYYIYTKNKKYFVG